MGRHVKAGVLVCLAALCVATLASAQGLYYKEIRKDDRIYVFNIAANAERFEKTGEMGIGITRPGTGPNGETVVGDNERALQLFYFKHGISEPVPDPPPAPPPAPPWRISGLVFGDYYNVTSTHLESANPSWKDQNGFWIRRIYFTYDYNLNSKITTRFRLEANSNGKLAGGSLTPYIKDAYVRWTYYGRQMVFLGIAPSASFNWEEGFWGLRHIEKTPIDFYRLDGSRDFVLSFEGPLPVTGLNYTAQYGNNSGQNSETDKYKAYRFEMRYDINPGIALEGFYGKFEQPLGRDQQMYKVFGGYRRKLGRAAVSYVRKDIESGSAAKDTRIEVTSAFGVLDFAPRKAPRTSIFARFDWAKGNNNKTLETGVSGVDGIDYMPISNQHDFTFGLAGAEFFVHPNFRISPNVEFVSYGDGPQVSGSDIKNDVIWRATFYWSF
jgi:hypothetical protein